MTRRRVLLALRRASPMDRLFTVASALCRRMGADLEVLADPERPDWAELQRRLAALQHAGLGCHLSQKRDLQAKDVVDHTHGHECIVSVVVGHPAAWATEGLDVWGRLDCPLVTATDPPEKSEKTPP